MRAISDPFFSSALILSSFVHVFLLVGVSNLPSVRETVPHEFLIFPTSVSLEPLRTSEEIAVRTTAQVDVKSTSLRSVSEGRRDSVPARPVVTSKKTRKDVVLHPAERPLNLVKPRSRRFIKPRVEDIDLSDVEVFKVFSSYYVNLSDCIRRHIRYPPDVLVERKEGMVYVTFVLYRTGQVSSVGLVESSGDPRLDRSALQSIRSSVPFPRFPPEIKEDKITLYLPVSFELD